MNLQHIAAIIIKDVRLFFKNRAAVILTLIVPVAIASFFGYVTAPRSGSGPTGRVKLWIASEDDSAISREVIQRLQDDEKLTVSLHPAAETRGAVAKGEVGVALVLPAGFGEAAGNAFFMPGGKPTVIMLCDPSRKIEASIAQGALLQHAMAVISRQVFSADSGMKWLDQASGAVEANPSLEGRDDLRELLASVRKWMQRPSSATAPAAGPMSGGLTAPFETSIEEVTGARGASYNGYAHSFGGMGLQFVLMFAVECAAGLLHDRRSGLWRRLRAAPVSRASVLTGRALSCAAVAFFTLTVCWLCAIVFFGVRVHGSWPGFLLVNMGAALLSASFALMLAGIGRSVEAMRGIAIFAVLMLVMLGGAWVPSFIFPEWLQRITEYIPTRWAVDGMDAMTWRGLPFSSVVLPVLSLAGCSVLFGLIAWWRFRWQGE